MNTSIPMDYSQINLYQGTRAPTGEVIRSQAGAYFWRCLYHRLTSTIEFRLPDTWEQNYFRNVLFGMGYIGIIKTAKYGIIPQFCTLSGYGIFRQPTKLLVASPLITYEGEIGTDCELIRLTPDYLGVCDIVDHYADELANLYGALNMAIENSKIAALFFPRNSAAAQAIKQITEKISSGEAKIFADRQLKEDITGSDSDYLIYSAKPKEMYIVDQVLDDIQHVITEFDREVGIPTIPEKKERYTEMEIASITSDSAARLSLWSSCLRETIDRVNQMYPELQLTFKTVAEKGGGDPDVSNPEIDSDRSV